MAPPPTPVAASTVRVEQGVSLHVLASNGPGAPVAAPGLFLARLVEATLAGPDGSPGLDAKALQGAVDFTHGQLAALPRPLRLAFTAGMGGFRTWVVLRHFGRFTRLPLSTRRRAVESWSFGRIGLFRQLFRPMRAVALLAYFEKVPRG